MFVKRVKNNGRNSQIVVSRTAQGLVKKLFEEQVPEIAQGIVEIKEIAREPGHRTKMAIVSTDARVDAVGACVGNRGARVNAVVQELGGEKIDIITWNEDPLAFIYKALSPATVLSVTAKGEKSAVAIVPDDKLSLAIGRDGQNARLAARLTGWKIDVKSASSPVLSVTAKGEKSAVAIVPDDKLSLAIGRDGQNARLAARLTGWKIDVKSASSPEAQEILAQIEAESEGEEQE